MYLTSSEFEELHSLMSSSDIEIFEPQTSFYELTTGMNP